MALTLALVAELNGANRRMLGQALAALPALRVAYVEVDLRRRDFKGSIRMLGYFGTQTWHGSMAIWCLLLTRDFLGVLEAVVPGNSVVTYISVTVFFILQMYPPSCCFVLRALWCGHGISLALLSNEVFDGLSIQPQELHVLTRMRVSMYIHS